MTVFKHDDGQKLFKNYQKTTVIKLSIIRNSLTVQDQTRNHFSPWKTLARKIKWCKIKKKKESDSVRHLVAAQVKS